MGGGAIWRGVARVANTVSPIVRAASPSPSSCSFCKVNAAAAQSAKASSARLHSCACTPETTPKAGSVGQGARAFWEPDEWEFAEEEDRIDHLVFGPLPCQSEVEEASSELQSALRLGLLAPSSDQAPAVASWGVSPAAIAQSDGSREVEESTLTENKEGELITRPLLASQLAVDWMEPPPIRTGNGTLQAGGRSVVDEAFHQFQHNPEVQGMVVSLATDPAVWDAVLANEKIQEFKRKLQGNNKGFLIEKKVAVVAEDDDELETQGNAPNVFARWQLFCMSKISQFKDLLTGLISSFLKAADKKVFAEEDGDNLDRTVKSCTMLALIVVCVVILKRLYVQVA